MAEAAQNSTEPDAELTSVASVRPSTVMLADVIGMSRLYASAGDLRAVEAIARCRNVLRDLVQAQGGRIVRTMGERVMALFGAADSAALAATRMHLAIESMPTHEDVKLTMRIAFHTGSVIQREDEVFGETVDMTAAMLGQDRKASRQHCSIGRKAQGFVLRDHSTNGTYVTPKGEREIVLLGDELLLTGTGVITLGQARAQAVDVIEYFCEDGRS